MKKLIILIIMYLMVQEVFLIQPVISQDSLFSLNFQEVSLGTVLKVLSTKTSRKFITDTELSRKKIVLSLKDITADEALNALLDTYDLYYIRQANTDIYVIKSKSGAIITAVSKIIYCNYAKASDLVAILSQKLNPGGNMTADDRTNSLIVTDMADTIEKIAALIKELDSPTPQVLIETRILDVKISNTLQLGVDITRFTKNDDYIYDQKFAPGFSQQQQQEQQEQQQLQQLVSGAFSSVKVGIIKDGYNIDALIEAVQSMTDGKVLSNPKILVLNNQTASITIVDEIPYQQLTQTAQAGSIGSTAFKKVGIIISVTPQVNKNGTIILKISPQQSFQTGASIEGIPVINTSSVKTTLMLKNGETAVIGGLIRESTTNSEFKVPILGDIPILGYLFKRTDKRKSRSELTIFVTATIIENTSIE